MKTKFVIILVLLLPFISSAQFSRSFYTTENGGPRKTNIVEVNGDMYFVSIRESVAGTLNVLYGIIDDNGETSDYNSVQDVSANYTEGFFFLSGVGVNSNDNIVLSVLTQAGTVGRLNHIEVDLSSNTITSSIQLANDYKIRQALHMNF